MTTLIYLFVISFVSLSVMFNRKLSLVNNEDIRVLEKETSLQIPYMTEIRHVTIRKIKKYGYVTLVMVIRVYFRSINTIKLKYAKLKFKLSNWHKHEIENGIEKKQISGFLKIVSEYKHKIRKIKHSIKEEEEEKITPP